MLTKAEQLRLLLGEEVPEGGSEDDTMFKEDVILHFLELGADNLDRSAYEGWRAKAAKFASLVDTTEGNYSRKYGQLLDNATAMEKKYLRSSGGLTEGRSRVGRIVRRDESDGVVTG